MKKKKLLILFGLAVFAAILFAGGVFVCHTLDTGEQRRTIETEKRYLQLITQAGSVSSASVMRFKGHGFYPAIELPEVLLPLLQMELRRLAKQDSIRIHLYDQPRAARIEFHVRTEDGEEWFHMISVHGSGGVISVISGGDFIYADQKTCLLGIVELVSQRDEWNPDDAVDEAKKSEAIKSIKEVMAGAEDEELSMSERDAIISFLERLSLPKTP